MTGPAVTELPGLGPRSAAMLERAGITTPEQLRALGPVAAFVRAKRANRGVSVNLLWALEGALTGQPWQQVSRKHRTALLLAMDDYENANPEPAG